MKFYILLSFLVLVIAHYCSTPWNLIKSFFIDNEIKFDYKQWFFNARSALFSYVYEKWEMLLADLIFYLLLMFIYWIFKSLTLYCVSLPFSSVVPYVYFLYYLFFKNLFIFNFLLFDNFILIIFIYILYVYILYFNVSNYYLHNNFFNSKIRNFNIAFTKTFLKKKKYSYFFKSF